MGYKYENDYKFTTEWFNKNIPHWEEWLEQFKDKEVNFLEVGPWEGRATVWLLENFPKANVTTVDTFEGGEEHQEGYDLEGLYQRYEHNIGYFPGRVRTYVGKSQEVLRDLTLRNYDFIYIDGSHMACDVLEDAVLSFRLLKSGGVLVFDDYPWGGDRHPHEKPQIAVDAFLRCYKTQYDILGRGWQVAIKKR